MKLVTFAAGTLDVLGLAEQEQPSWTIAEWSHTPNEHDYIPRGLSSNVSLQQQSPAGSFRSEQWSRPWRESRRCPTPRWEMAGLVTRTAAAPVMTDSCSQPRPKQKVIVDLSARVPSAEAPEYTTKYFGMVNGELGVMSKVDPLKPRPVSPGPWSIGGLLPETDLERNFMQVNNEENYDLPKAASAAEAAEVDNADASVVNLATPERGRPLSPRADNDAENRLPGSSSSSPRNQQARLFTAQMPPATKPVEGPEPAAWVGSRLGLLCAPSKEGNDSSPGTHHGVTTTASEWTSAIFQAMESHSCSTSSSGGGGGGACGGGVSRIGRTQACGGDDDSSAFALSFSTPCELSCGEGDGGAPSPPSPSMSTNELQPTNAGGVGGKAAKAVPVTPISEMGTKATYPRRKRGRAHHGSGKEAGSNPAIAATCYSKTDVLPRNGKRGARNGAKSPPPAVIEVARKPQPELYDIWIPQHAFQGKGLPTLKRVRAGLESQPKPSSGLHTLAGARDKFRSNKEVTPDGLKINNRCNCLHGLESFITDDAAAPQQASPRIKITRSGKTPERIDRNTDSSTKPTVPFAMQEITAGDAASAESGICGFEVGRGSGGRGGFDHGDARGSGPAATRDAGGVILDGGESLVGWQQEEKAGRAREADEHVGDEHFDFAKIFSWQTAAKLVEEAEADAAEAKRNKERRRIHPVYGDENACDDELLHAAARQQQAVAAAAAAEAAAASERTRVRSEHAALVAVGRMRAPHSVFNTLHRTPSRPEMRRSVTHGRFSPAGRKIWRQSEGLSPRTGQLCLSPRRSGLAGEVLWTGTMFPSSRSGGGLDATDWVELRPPLSSQQGGSRWGFTEGSGADGDSELDGRGGNFVGGQPTNGKGSQGTSWEYEGEGANGKSKHEEVGGAPRSHGGVGIGGSGARNGKIDGKEGAEGGAIIEGRGREGGAATTSPAAAGAAERDWDLSIPLRGRDKVADACGRSGCFVTAMLEGGSESECSTRANWSADLRPPPSSHVAYLTLSGFPGTGNFSLVRPPYPTPSRRVGKSGDGANRPAGDTG